MNTYNNGYFLVEKKHRDNVFNYITESGITGTISYSNRNDGLSEISLEESYGDIDSYIDDIVKFCTESGILVNGYISFYGDYTGAYEIINNEVSELDQKDLVLREVSPSELLYEFVRRNVPDEENDISKDNMLRKINHYLKVLPDEDVKIFYSFCKKLYDEFVAAKHSN